MRKKPSLRILSTSIRENKMNAKNIKINENGEVPEKCPHCGLEIDEEEWKGLIITNTNEVSKLLCSLCGGPIVIVPMKSRNENGVNK
jgi:predicted RNA-binding Zn-ribbon protein involved in translation (DUF1610 family)